jgi:hypothetical protein
LAKENEEALTSEDKDATLKRVPPASLVSTTGNEWKTLSAEVKKQYEERYVVTVACCLLLNEVFCVALCSF